MTPDHDVMPSPEPGPELAERNREIIAARCGWPDGALAAVRELEKRFPGWHSWWTDHPWRRDGNVPDGPAYGAARTSGGPADSLYAATPGGLAEMICQAEERDRAARPWLYRGPRD